MFRSSAIVVTATCRRASFRAETCMRGGHVLAVALLSLWVLACGPAQGAALRFELAQVEHPALQLEGLSLQVAEDARSAQLLVARLEFAGQIWSDLRLDCSDLRLQLPEFICAHAVLRSANHAGAAQASFRLHAGGGESRLSLALDDGEAVHLHWGGSGEWRADFSAINLARLLAFLPDLREYAPAGRFSGNLEGEQSAAGGVSLRLTGHIAEGAFSSPDGLQAAEGLGVDLAFALHEEGEAWNFDGKLGWQQGEAYIHPFYAQAWATLSVAGRLADEMLEVSRAELEIEGAEAITARARLDLSLRSLQSLSLRLTEADLQQLGPRFVAPLLAPARAEALQLAGHVSAELELGEEGLQALDLKLDGVRIEDGSTALALGPVSGSVPWRADGPTQLQLVLEGGRWDQLELGPFELQARLQGKSVEIEQLSVPVLDGRLVLNDLSLHYAKQGWSGSGSAVIEPISVPLLTEALGLPLMSGVLAASLPGLRVSPGELALDGALVVSVFDGYLHVSDLLVLEPFGVSARLFSNVMARNLNLGLITDMFSFGGVTGFVDMDLAGLELRHWKPVAFDAHVRSSPGRYARRISQRAVQNIGALAGPGATLALQRGILGFFESFGYRQIGLRCRLEAGVCTMGGIGKETSGPYDIVQGGGIPALNVIGYNRRVDWNELLERLQRVVESNSAPVIH